MVSAIDALQLLREGNRRFVNDEVDRKALAKRTHQASAADGQDPIAIVLACSDSRVPTELIFDREIGRAHV